MISEAALVGFRRAAGDAAAQADLHAALGDAVARARQARPTIDVPSDAFVEALGHAVAGDADLTAAIAALHVGDLWLATACAAHDRAALAELERVLASLVPTLARTGADAALIDDVIQVHRTRLLSSTEDRPPRILAYRGRGDLRSWLKVALVRDMVRALRRDRPVSCEDDEFERLMDTGGDVELRLLEDTYRDRFRQAFAAALAGLSARDRNLLRYHLIDELNIDEIGAIHRVHRSTAARWLVKLREDLHEGTRAELMRSLELGPSEIDSVLRLIRSRLDASIARGLGGVTV